MVQHPTHRPNSALPHHRPTLLPALPAAPGILGRPRPRSPATAPLDAPVGGFDCAGGSGTHLDGDQSAGSRLAADPGLGGPFFVTRAQLKDAEREFIDPYLPIGEYDPYPERLRRQFEGVIRRFRTGAQWREVSGASSGAWSTLHNRFRQ
ncbi:hypothetical protein CG736_20790 [Kitasatospora sp. CB02891]|nr:hypothetical protein CG736_20790 [Kitasatospora sp. CB02891]